MKQALDKVRKAVARQDIVPQFARYLIGNGLIQAFDGRFTAACSVDYTPSRPFLAPRDEFERLVDRFPSEVTIDYQPEGKVLALRAGRMSGKIKLEIDSTEVNYPTPGEVWSAPPRALLQSLRLVRPFISDNAVHAWALCACLQPGKMLATTNVSLAEVDCHRLEGAGQLLPCWSIDYILSRSDSTLTGMQLTENYAAFLWGDGSWMRTQLINETFPETAAGILNEVPSPDWVVTSSWRAAYKTISDSIDKGLVEIYKDRLVGYFGTSVIEHSIPETPTPTEGVSKYRSEFLDAVIENSTHWQPDLWPNPAPFRGPGLRGIILGRM